MSKWTDDENKLLVELVGKKKKWKDISKYFPGRSTDSCRVHFGQYLDEPSLDDEMKTNFAKAYELYVEIISQSQIL